jgi:hypothetical protein
LFVQQFSNVPKEHCFPGEELANLASEEVGDGLRYDLQGQWIAPIDLDEPLLFRGSPDDFFFHEELLASDTIQSSKA